MLIARDLEGVRRASARDWMALLSATIAEPSVGCVAQVRRALREWRADHELTAVVADPRDQRVRARRAADHRVARADRVSRIADARESTAIRQQLMYATRGRKADSSPQSGLAADTTIQIFAGVTMLPRGRGE